MKKQFLLVVLLTVFAGSIWGQENADIVKKDDRMPSFTIVSDNGTEIKSNTFKGKVTVISFFATWCPPCQKELAAIEKILWPAYKNNKDFSLLVIGREHNDAELKEYNEKKGFSFPLYPDKDRAIYSKFANSLIPRVYLIGKDGKVKYTHKGFSEEDFKVLMKEIDSALKK